MREPKQKRTGPFFRWLAVAEIVEAVLLAVDDIFRPPPPRGGAGQVPARQLFGPGANHLFRLAIGAGLFFVVGVPAFLMLLPVLPVSTGVNRFVPQPVPFSHEHHVGEIGIDCRFCHRSVEKSSFAGIPPTQTCMKCHRVLFKDAPMLAPVRESFATGRPLSWNRVYDVPDFVYFNHGIHVSNGVPCQACHGNLGGMPWVRKTKTFFMGACLACHRNAGRYVGPVDAATLKGLTNCSTCHR